MHLSSFRPGLHLPRLLIALLAVGVMGVGCVDLTPPWQNANAGGSVGSTGGSGGDGSGGTGGPASEPDAQGAGGGSSLDAPGAGSGGAVSTDGGGGAHDAVAPEAPSGADGLVSADGVRAETGGPLDGRADTMDGAGGRDDVAVSSGGAMGTGGAGGASGSGGSGSGGALSLDGGHCSADGVLDSGICWYLGELGANCSTTCSTRGGTSPEAAGHVGTAAQKGSPTECSRLLGLLGTGGEVQPVALPGLSQGLGCHVSPTQTPTYRWVSSPAYNDNASDPAAQLLCGCLQ